MALIRIKCMCWWWVECFSNCGIRRVDDRAFGKTGSFGFGEVVGYGLEFCTFCSLENRTFVLDVIMRVGWWSNLSCFTPSVIGTLGRKHSGGHCMPSVWRLVRLMNMEPKLTSLDKHLVEFEIENKNILEPSRCNFKYKLWSKVPMLNRLCQIHYTVHFALEDGRNKGSLLHRSLVLVS